MLSGICFGDISTFLKLLRRFKCFSMLSPILLWPLGLFGPFVTLGALRVRSSWFILFAGEGGLAPPSRSPSTLTSHVQKHVALILLFGSAARGAQPHGPPRPEPPTQIALLTSFPSSFLVLNERRMAAAQASTPNLVLLLFWCVLGCSGLFRRGGPCPPLALPLHADE